MNAAPFESASQALAFAFSFTMQQYDRPLVNRLADGPAREGKGLKGMDGAGQAAMIRRRVAKLTPLHQAVLVSRFAPAQIDCACGRPCCRGKLPNFEWQAGIRLLAEYGEREALKGCSINRHLTLLVLRKLLGHKLQLADIANTAGIAENTASSHHAKLKAWFRGESLGRNGEAPKEGVEQLAFAEIEAELQEARIVGMHAAA
ncbi:hypothetical protein CAL26_23770 [Bordetella genomosp. 9]|uniref:Post-SET domain-containing protein n=1 Tax=Bordetella genomosp. 9 TaxID=1416803 RepID=A0A261R659_9BORD|nr:hypothetical protein [Bordetella genomosp. 9]OZI20516.1 hypothetical protein CAL26_23770 [Bordetella genomosp. 9]